MKNDCLFCKIINNELPSSTVYEDNLIKIIYNDRLEEIPRILETPYVDKKYAPYKYEIEMIRKKEFNKDLIEIIKKQN